MITQWPLKRLGDVCEIRNGATPATNESALWDGPHAWITPAEMGSLESPYVSLTKRTLTNDGLSACSATLAPPKSVILSCRAPIGHLVINQVPMATNQGCKSLVPGSLLDHKFLYFFLKANVELLDSLGTGATFRELSATKLRDVEIPVPSLAEQQRIVDKLDGIWHAIDATADANVTLAGLTQDVLDAALTERFGSLFERHPVSRLGDVVEIARGGSPRPISEFLTEDEDGVNWIKIGDASASRKYIHSTRERIKPSGVARSRMVYEGDFLLSNSMSFGRPYILRTTGCIHDGWLVLRDNAKKFNQDFLYYLLGSRLMYDEFSKRAQGSTVQNLNSSLVADVRVPVPPIDVQVKASAFAREIEESAHKLGEIYSSKSSKLETYRQSVLEAAFRGEL